ncbi:putative C2H2 finger domain protein [Seiridium cardinale]|uniref:C2H2 finger domain protein n=1 Tax=Seiridium cardinale TaxID=138064 RepID=A0ABR2XMB2_9PEZI
MPDANRGARGMGRQSDEIGGNPFDFLNIDLDSELHDGNLHPPEFYQKGIKELDEYDYNRKEYAPGTNKIMHAVSKKWELYCERILQKDLKSVLRKINFNVTFFFLNWCLNQKTGKGGRRKKGIATKSSLTTFWCNFRLVFERETGSKIDGRVDRGRIGNALVRLGEKYKLTHEKRENRSMTLTDLKHQIATTLRTTDKSFKLGEMRILAILFLSLLAPAGSRPTSILKLRFGDSRVLLARDPDGGPHRLVIKFTLSFTKQYLGKKASKTFLIPEIIYDPSLLLSPHVFLLGILFKNHLNIINGENVLRLPLKDDLKDVLVFRRAEKDVYGFTTSRSVGISSAMMTTWLRRIGELAGFEHNTMSYSLRYNAGNNMDQNGRHGPNSTTFQTNYLSRHVRADLWAMQRDLEPQQELLKQLTSHGHTVSARRPADLTSDQPASLNEHPVLVQMEQELQKLPLYSQERRKPA